MEQLLKEYKTLPNDVKEHLVDMSCFKTCYDRDENISDDMVVLITSLAKECWLDDEYGKASADYYAEYLLDAVYDYHATKKQIENLESYDIVEKFNNEASAGELLKFDISDKEYLCTTTDNNKYYATEDGLYVVNSRDIVIQEPHPMEDDLDIIFSLLNENKISYMPLSTHYHIRCMIKDDIMGNTELEKKYQKGINNYKNYCRERFITSKDIQRVVGENKDMDIFEEDNLYSEKNKLFRLKEVRSRLTEKDINKYSYVASLDNGIDYYLCEDKYVAIDKNFVMKEFKNKDLLLLDELKGIHKFAYLSESESKKIANSITKQYFKNGFNKKWSIPNLENYLQYENNKELNSFKSQFVMSEITREISRINNQKNIQKKVKNDYSLHDKNIEM